MPLLRKIKRRKSKGNPGNPGTRPKKPKKRAKRIKVKKFPPGMFKSKPAPAANKIAAMGNLVASNPVLRDQLTQMTGSTDVVDFAKAFDTMTPEQQQQMVYDSRTSDSVDEEPSTYDKVKDVAADAAEIYSIATGKDKQAELEDKRKKQTTMIIVAIVVVVIIILLIMLLKGRKKTVV